MNNEQKSVELKSSTENKKNIEECEGERNSISSAQLCEAGIQKSAVKLINFVKFNKSHILTSRTNTHTHKVAHKRKSFKLPNQPSSWAKVEAGAGVKLLALRWERQAGREAEGWEGRRGKKGD